MSSALIEQQLRRFLLATTAFILLGTIVELWLSEHTGEPQQLIPFGLCISGLIALAALWFRPTRNTIIALRVVMVIVGLGSLLGIYFHLQGNFAFELEIRPNATVRDVIMQALMGVNPLLATGILALTSVLATAATYYHPAMGNHAIE